MRKLLFPATLAAAAAVPAHAQPPAGTQGIQEIQVVSASRRSEGLGDVNAAVSVIGRQELDLVSLTHFQEAVNRLPGVNAHRNNGQESLLAIRSPVLTGAGACSSFLIAENSIPVRSHGFCNVNEMFDAHTENAERIEVVRGPGSAFWSSNALHGLINVVLPEPGEAGDLTLEAGPHGYTRGKASIGHDGGDTKHLLLLHGLRDEGYRDDSGVAQHKISWLYNHAARDGTTLDGGFTVSHLNQDTAGFVTGPNAYEDAQLRVANPNPEAYRNSDSARVWTRFSREVEGWELTFTPYWREVNMNFLQHFLPGQPIEDFEHRSLGMQFAAYTETGAGDLALGIDLEDTGAALMQHQPGPTEGSAFLRGSIPQGRHYDFEVDARQMAGFASFTQDLGDGWEVSLGVRVEHTKYIYDNLMIDGRTDESGAPCPFGCRYNRPADRSDGFTEISPKLGLAYALNDSHTLQLRVQRGARAPQATELYRLQNAQSVADLDSVRLDSAEMAFVGAGDGWDYSASLYSMDRKNGIITNSARENVNGSRTRHRGFELGMGFELSETLSVRGAANLAKHTYENSRMSGGADILGNDVDTAPNVFGNVRLSWRPQGAFMAELEWVSMGEYFTNPENTAKYEGHDLVNIRTRYQVTPCLEFSLNLMNVLDVKYAERADWTSFAGDRYLPGEEVRAFLAMNWSFL